MPLIGYFKPRGPNGLGHNTTAEEATTGLNLTGKTFLLTGCNSGIGLETLRVLTLRGAHVLAMARTVDKAQQALAGLSVPPALGTPLACDLSEPASVRQAVRAVTAETARRGKPLDGIVANAGIMALPRLEVKHGLELQFLTNHMGHFLLVTGLLGQLAPQGRVVMLSSAAHRSAPAEGIQFDNLDGARGYRAWRNYGQTKLANLLFARQLSHRLPQPGQTAHAVHPGVINTPLWRYMPGVIQGLLKALLPFRALMLKTIAQGAATQCYVAAHPAAAQHNGAYWVDCNPARSRALGEDPGLAERLWTRSEELAARLP
ncbi:MAG: SDR family NAD(P)-dependent oxidoreductase [Deltaproteobacteria bacterium]|nr:SDR family NAD(P)-dependent oxidoreductase [Deltaproteobacteria bacterium]